MANRFTEDEMRQAKETSLTELAEAYGYHPKKIGRLYTLEEYDSIRIYNDRTWCRWSRMDSRSENGGSQIDFLLKFCGIGSVSEAVRILLEFQGISGRDAVPAYYKHQAGAAPKIEKAPFVLPEPVEGSYRRAYAYLIQSRGLSPAVVNYFVKDLKLLYEDKEHHNLVFLGKDKEGVVRYAAKRGTADQYGRKYRGDVAGNNKNYGINITNPESDELRVFEANIDLMSYLDITGDYWSNKLVLGMVADNPLVQFLKDYPHVRRIWFCLDNDEAGMRAMSGTPADGMHPAKPGLLEKYQKLGYDTFLDYVPLGSGCKDWNEYLKFLKQSYPERVKVLEGSGSVTKRKCR